jgi:putative ABC transport system permease protein
MIANYIRIAWRNCTSNWFYPLLNVAGLSIGLGFAFLIGAFIWKETRVNKSLADHRNQYIIQSKWVNPDMGLDVTTVGPLAKALKEQYPHLVINYYRWDGVTTNVSKGDKVFREGLQIGDSTFLSMFGFHLLYGDPASALHQPYSVVIREDKALKYFGKKDVVGQTLSLQSFTGTNHDFLITGVLQAPEENSVTFLNRENDNGFFVSDASIGFFGRNLEDWNNPYIVDYIQLKEGISPQALKRPMQQLLEKNASLLIAKDMQPWLAPLQTYYIEKDNGAVKKMLYTISFIAVFLLAMAIINFITLSISRSSSRIREIGVRKVMGGTRKQLITQFLVESFFMVMLAAIIALLIYTVARPFISVVLLKQVPSIKELPFSFGFAAMIMVLIIAIIAGIYPSLVLSSFKAVDSLKGKLQVKEKTLLRTGLLGFQFFIASLVLVATLIVSRQVSYFFTKDLGYDKTYVVTAQVPRDWTKAGVNHMQAIARDFSSLPQVKQVSLSWQIPNGWDNGFVPVYTEGRDSTEAVNTEVMEADENYCSAYGITIIHGRYLRDSRDTLDLVINESAVRAFGWKEAGEAIGKRVFFTGNFPMTIVGVVRDFHSASMKERIQPTMISHVSLYNRYRFLSFKLKPGNISSSIEALRKKWSALLPGSAFEYGFMDDTLARLYDSEIRLKKAAQLATILALIIVILGVMGLISLSVHKRTKEIGIRKVLGATIPSICYLFIKDFIPVMIIGSILSIPITWNLMQRWLNDYAYRIPITMLPFIYSLVLLSLLTIFLISMQTAKTALANPTKNLLTE